MTSEAARPQEAFVWIWLPGQTSPVVAGQIRARGAVHAFRYGGSYLARDNAIPIFEPELPLRPGWLEPPPGLSIANALRDAAPDAWGRRVIAYRLGDGRGEADDRDDLDEMTFMLLSGSDRAGALDFQASASWASVCDEAALSDADRRLLWRRQFLNDLAFEGLGDWFAGELALAH